MVILKEKESVKYRKAPCAKEGCAKKALTLSEFCWDHIADKEQYREAIAKAIREKEFGIRANLSGANLFDTDLSGTDLVGADLSGTDLTGADLSGADLTRANLEHARLWNADLSDAKLVETNLAFVDFWQAKLPNARLWRADLYKAKSLTKKNFQCKKKGLTTRYRIREAGHITAEETYRNLKRYFIGEGRYGDASWASFKEKTMEKIRLRKSKDISYIPAALMGLLCGYGEKPQRIIFSSFSIIFIYAILFFVLKSITPSASGDFTFNFGDYIYYSVVTFTTLGYGDIIPKMSTLYRLLAVSEAFLGAFLMGLFIFTLARKYSAR